MSTPRQPVILSIAGVTFQLFDDAAETPVWLTTTCEPFRVASASASDPMLTISITRDPAFRCGQERLLCELTGEPGGFRIHGDDFTAERSRCGVPVQVQAHPEAGLAGILRWLATIHVIESGGLLLHAASFAMDGSGIICAGASGRGKSTLSKLVRDRVTLFTDETTAMRFMGEMPVAHATPFSGELGPVSGPASAPLEALFILRHGPEHAVRSLRPAEAVQELVGCVFTAMRLNPWMGTVMATAERLARSVPCYELQFRPEPNVLDIIQAVNAKGVAR